VIKELNLKFKTKENPHQIKKDNDLTALHSNLNSRITLKNIASSENNREDDSSDSDEDFLGFYDK
jgi:hypothetical protein